jgi:hypothetical protein
MSKEPTRTDLPAGDFISENAVNGVPAHSAAAGDDASAPAGAGRRLRRWSVAELIARAVAPPPSTT